MQFDPPPPKPTASQPRLRRVFAYDVVDDKRRARVVKLLGREALSEEDFAQTSGGGVYLTPAGRKRFLQHWEQWLRAPHRGAVLLGGVVPASAPTDVWRHALRGQAVAGRCAILNGEVPQWYHDTAAGDDAGLEVQVPRKPAAADDAVEDDD